MTTVARFVVRCLLLGEFQGNTRPMIDRTKLCEIFYNIIDLVDAWHVRTDLSSFLNEQTSFCIHCVL